MLFVRLLLDNDGRRVLDLQPHVREMSAGPNEGGEMFRLRDDDGIRTTRYYVWRKAAL